MDSDKTNQSQLNLEHGGIILLTDAALTIHADGIPDLTLGIADLRARLWMIRWFGRLLDLMNARLNDISVRRALVGKRDIPDVVVALGTAWTRLHWPGGSISLSASDVEGTLALLGVNAPVFHWRKYCHRLAEEMGAELEAEFLE
jgi:hypothetical protein